MVGFCDLLGTLNAPVSKMLSVKARKKMFSLLFEMLTHFLFTAALSKEYVDLSKRRKLG
jgi:Ca2+/H+ antiporter